MSFWSTLPRPIMGLSPMDGVTDATFRRVIAQHGRPDVTFTEFTHVHDVCRGPEFLLNTLIYSELERPVVAQLYGKDPALFYQATHAACELGFDGIDINMGCPSKNVASSGSGAGLIRTPDVAHAIMQATSRAIHDWANGQTLERVGFKPARIAAIRAMNVGRQGAVPVPRRLLPLSVKTRLGYDSVIVEDWVSHLIQEKPVAITLHGRTLQQMYRGEADWSAIARAVQLAKGTGILLLGNGDVQSLDEVVSRVQSTQVDGVLVGRAVLGAPWFFHAKEQARAFARADVSGARIKDQPMELAARFALMLDHARQFQAICGPGQFHRMRKHLGWYCKGFPHAAALRGQMFRVSSAEDVEAMIARYQANQIVDGPATGGVSGEDLSNEAQTLVSRCS
ncbi:MAG: tRNA-dihydrouridine synthase [Nitrospira sp.]|jgi:nifR3 family TIM-barrel protein|nr:MAG: tRNA-dihydrouridine synthase [Nitrospira sp. CG24D]TKB87708.1 MAG: tRNA-dihydrouridine synthase [Nitrospira sp.]